LPVTPKTTSEDVFEADKMRRFAKDLALALDASATEVSSALKNTVAKVCKEYLC